MVNRKTNMKDSINTFFLPLFYLKDRTLYKIIVITLYCWAYNI